LYKRAQFEEAMKWLTRANRARGGKDPVILDHLGDCAWRLGLNAESVEHWSAAVSRINERIQQGELRSADERRVHEQTPKKIEDAEAGRSPSVAPLAITTPAENDAAPPVP
jgi:hypothetical protein